jgi:hypothetical protein
LDIRTAVETIPFLGERVDTARARMAAVWENREPDYLPLIISGVVPEDLRVQLPRFNYKEAYYDPEKMLFNQLPGVLASAYSPGDNIPSVRADLGVGIFPTLLGAINSVFPDIRPWITGHVSKQQLARMTPDDIDPYKGEFARGLEYMRYFQELLAGRAYVYVMDVQGPIDTAHQVLGDEFFTELYDDPPFVHHLLELSTQALIKGIKACKAVTAEPLNQAYHYNSTFVSRGGIKSSEDTPTLLSADHLDEYFVPYTRRLLAEFGGGYIHFCGSNQHLYERCVNMVECVGINLGNPERYDVATLLTTCHKRQQVFNGVLRYAQDYDDNTYYRKIWQDLGQVKKRLLLHAPSTKSPATAVALWHDVQDQAATVS